MTYNGENNYIMQAISALGEIMKYGKGILTTLMNSGHTFVIKNGQNEFVPDSKRASQVATVAEAEGFSLKGAASVGCGGTVYWDPEDISSGPNSAGSNTRPAFVGLAHELGHGNSANSGTANHTKFDPRSRYIEFMNITVDEYNAIYYENVVRGNAHLPLRTAYSVRV